MDVEQGHARDRALRRAHASVLAVIAGCAIVSALQTHPADQPVPDRRSATLAVCLALGTIVARRIASRAGVPGRVRATLTLCAYSLAVSIALLGVYLAVTQGAVQTGIVFSLGAGIFCLRPPPPLAPVRRLDDPPGHDDSSAA